MSPAVRSFGPCGFGLTAARELVPGTVIARFEGPIVGFSAVPEAEIRHAILLDTDRWMIPQTSARYLNHSCEPNCRVLDSLDVATLRDVGAGEDLTISYNTVEPWERSDYFGHPEHYFGMSAGPSTAAAGRRSVADELTPII